MTDTVSGEYRRRDTTVVYALAAAGWAGAGLTLLVVQGSTSGWFFLLAAMNAAGAVLSSRRPYSVMTAQGVTIWASPFRPQSVPWSTIVSARRDGVRVHLELAEGKSVNVRWDPVPAEARESFLDEFAAYLGPRWKAEEHDVSSLARDLRWEALRQWGMLVVVSAVTAAAFGVMPRTGYLEMPDILP